MESVTSAGPLMFAGGPLSRLIDDPRVRVAEMDPRLARAGEGLFAEEAKTIERAVLSRRQQYTAGRWLARRALAELGLAPRAVPSDAQRTPVWPEGIVGSITHTHTWCAVALAKQSEVHAIGVDVEASTPLEANLWERVCRPEEREFLRARAPERSGVLAKAIFSAKESAYKALYPRVRAFLDFQGMCISLAEEPDGESWRFTAELRAKWGELEPGYVVGTGKLLLDAELLVSAMVL